LLAINEGIQRAKGDYVAILNQRALPGPTWLCGLLLSLGSSSSSSVTIVGSKILDPLGSILSGGIDFQWLSHPWKSENLLLPFHRLKGVRKGDSRLAQDSEVFAVSGMSLLASSSLMKHLLFNETFEHLADVDFCLRAFEELSAQVIFSSASTLEYDPSRDQVDLFLSPERLFRFSGDVVEQFGTVWGGRNSLMSRFLAGRENMSVIWDGYLNDCTGWASEAISYVTQLEKKIRFLGIVGDDHFCPGYPLHVQESLYRLRTIYVAPGSVQIWVSHKPPPSYPRFPYKGILYYEERPPLVVGRSMVESVVLPEEWKEHFARVDEVWVPSRFLLDVFREGGVPAETLFHLPESLDIHLYDPDATTPLPLPLACNFSFLSVFKWEERKGWDILLEAFAEEFRADEGVCLFIQTQMFQQRGGATVQEKIEGFLAEKFPGRVQEIPPIVAMTERLTKMDMPRLYKAADGFVLATRGEGWGLPAMEAMAMRLPTIATNFSGLLDFMAPGNGYLVEVEGLVRPSDSSLYRSPSLRWAQPSLSSLRSLMRSLLASPSLRARTARTARAHILRHFSEEAVSQLVLARLLDLLRRNARGKGQGEPTGRGAAAP